LLAPRTYAVDDGQVKQQLLPAPNANNVRQYIRHHQLESRRVTHDAAAFEACPGGVAAHAIARLVPDERPSVASSRVVYESDLIVRAGVS